MIDSLITINASTPGHLVSYWLGVLVGMGISYTLSPESPMFREMRGTEERMREDLRLARIHPLETTSNGKGYRIIHQTGDSISVHIG